MAVRINRIGSQFNLPLLREELAAVEAAVSLIGFDQTAARLWTTSPERKLISRRKDSLGVVEVFADPGDIFLNAVNQPAAEAVIDGHNFSLRSVDQIQDDRDDVVIAQALARLRDPSNFTNAEIQLAIRWLIRLVLRKRGIRNPESS